MCNNHQAPIKRHFWKCTECLSHCAIEQADMYAWDRVKCGLCQSFMWYMGRVEQTRLKRDEVHCACDVRCTSATGPNCNCRCGGVYHGTHAVVHVTVDTGGIPVAQVKPDARIMRELKEFQALRQILRDELTELSRGGYLPREQWSRKVRIGDALSHAMKLTSHAGRMKTLRAVATQYPAGTAVVSHAMATAFGMHGLPNTVVLPDSIPSREVKTLQTVLF